MRVKRCPKCREEKPATLEYFHSDSSKNDGLYCHCKICVLEREKAYYEANKERKKAYYEANKEVILEREKAYREANKEAIVERDKAYYRTPKGRYNRIKIAAKRRDIRFSLPFELYESKLWGKPCHYCGCDIETTGLDRKDNSKGYTPDNVVPCCRSCNERKGPKLYEEFLQEIKTNP